MKLYIMLKLIPFVFCLSVNLIFSQSVTTLASQISAQRIEGLSIDKYGNLYTPSGPGSVVYKITPNGEISTFASGLNFPQGGGTDSEGNLYISNWNSGVITKITPVGEKTTFLTGLSGPTGITFSKTYNELYVSNYSSNSITKYVIASKTATVFASGQGINGPDGIVFDEEGNLYTANFNDNKINKISASGTVTQFAVLPGNSSGYITYAKGYIYASGHRSHKIYKITLEGEVSVLAGTGSPGFKDGEAAQAQFNLPNGITASLTGDSLFVSDADNRAIRIIDLLNSTTGIRDINHNTPIEFKLEQNFPNPFNPVTQIHYDLARDSFMSLTVFDLIGKEVAVLEKGFKPAGRYKIFFNGISLASGIYFYSLSVDNRSQTKKLVLLK